MTSGILLCIAAVYMALVGLGLVFFPRTFGAGAVPVDASPALWGLFNGGRELTRVFVVVHLLFTLAFIRAGRKILSATPG